MMFGFSGLKAELCEYHQVPAPSALVKSLQKGRPRQSKPGNLLIETRKRHGRLRCHKRHTAKTRAFKPHFKTRMASTEHFGGIS